jgi:hypothetical protein
MGSSLDSFHNNLGDQPLTRMAGWALPPALLEMSKQSRTCATDAAKLKAIRDIFMAISEDAYIIPIYRVHSANMIWPHFHTTLGQESGFSQYWARYWLEP